MELMEQIAVIKAKSTSTQENMDSAEYLLEELDLLQADTFWSRFFVKPTGIASDKQMKYNIEQAKEESVHFLRSLETSQNRATYRVEMEGDEQGPLEVLDMLPEERAAHEKKIALDAEVANSDYEKNQMKPGRKRKPGREDTDEEAESRAKFYAKRKLVVKHPDSLHQEQEPGTADTPTPSNRPVSTTSALDQIMLASKESTKDFKQIIEGRQKKKEVKELSVFVWTVLGKRTSYQTEDGYLMGQTAIEDDGLAEATQLMYATDALVGQLSLLLKTNLVSRFEDQMNKVRD